MNRIVFLIRYRVPRIPDVSETVAQAIDKAASQAGQQFKKCEDPFYVSSESQSGYIRSNSMLFCRVAEKLVEWETCCNLQIYSTNRK
jgi:hypothetical protein